MPFSSKLPLASGVTVELPIALGKVLFVVGPNGSGKSSLMLRLNNENQQTAYRIAAHRQTWLESSSHNLTPDQRRSQYDGMRSLDATVGSHRWRDAYSAMRVNVAIFDLIDAENVRARRITAAVDAGGVSQASADAVRIESPLKSINSILRESNLSVTLSLENSDQIMARRAGFPAYSIAELSDGERNALLVGATVLTVPPGSLILIDEPERHLHRSISAPLLKLLFSKRPDCAFVVSTHDVMLPAEIPEANTLLLRACEYGNSSVAVSWKADLLDAGAEIDEGLKTEIVGSRQTVLFVEGRQQSLDKPLYQLLFPEVSIIAKEGCRDVERVVAGIRSSADLHWLRAIGIVDSDHRSEGDIAALKANGIYALPVYSVEGLYYCEPMLEGVAVRHAVVLLKDPATMAASARAKAIALIRPHIDRLAIRIAERRARDMVLAQLPTSKDFIEKKSFQVKIDLEELRFAEASELTALLDDSDLDEVIRRYPIRETPALDAIANDLGFRSRSDYEGAVRKLIGDNEEARQKVLALLPGLAEACAGRENP